MAGSLAAADCSALDSPGTVGVTVANTTIGAAIAGTPERDVAASPAAATEGPFATVAAVIRQMRAFAATPTAWRAAGRVAGSNWRAVSHAFHRRSSCASTDTAVAAGGQTSPVHRETCTSGTAAVEAVLREMTADALGMHSAEDLAVEVGSAADEPSGPDSEARLARAPTEETAEQFTRASVLAYADC